jgi:glycerol-3-phosphate dehydrogenase (NAD(P)+)
MKTVCILGAGVMGSAMSLPFSDRGMEVRLVGTHLDDDIITSVTASQFHPKLNVTLPERVRAYRYSELATAIAGADFVLLGVSSAGVMWAIDRLCQVLRAPIPIVLITKGMSPELLALVPWPDVVQRELKSRLGLDVPVAGIAGPCIAGELAVRRQTGVVVVSRDAKLAHKLCLHFDTSFYDTRPSQDMMGVELCAAYKNFYAIAVGWAHGILDTLPESENKARNNNAAAILFHQAVRELAHLVSALGGEIESAYGMPGLGDLYVTCQAGRNSRLGNNLGRGLTYAEVKAGPMKGDTIEGAELGLATSATLHSLMRAVRLDANKLPLMRGLLDALNGNAPFMPHWQAFQAA